MRHIYSRNVPALFQLNYGMDGIILSLRKQTALSFIRALEIKPKKESRDGIFHDLPAFVSPSAEVWGFGPVMRREKEFRESWMSWTCLMPDGMKDESAKAVFATLQVAFSFLQFVQHSDWAGEFQMISIHGFSVTPREKITFFFELSPLFCDGFRKNPVRIFESMENALALCRVNLKAEKLICPWEVLKSNSGYVAECEEFSPKEGLAVLCSLAMACRMVGGRR